MRFSVFRKKETSPEIQPDKGSVRVIKGTGIKNLPPKLWSSDKPPGGELPTKTEPPHSS